MQGEINQRAQKNIYTGGTTATAAVYVDNATNKIYVNTKLDISSIEKELEEANKNYTEFIKSRDVLIDKIETAEKVCNVLTEKVSNLDKKLDMEVLELKTSVKQLKQSLEYNVYVLNDKIKAVEVKILDEIGPKLEKLSLDIKDTNIRIDNLDVKVDTIKSELEKKIQQLASDIKDDIYPKLEALDIKINTVDVKVDTTKEELQKEISTTKVALETQILETKSELKTEIGATKSELQTEIAVTKTNLEAAILSTKVELDTKIDTTKAEIEEKISKPGFSVIDGKLCVTYLV